MPLPKGVGVGWLTPTKLDHLKAIVEMHVKITRAVLKKNPHYERAYHFIDATAGPGEYEVNGKEVEGSPIVFLSVAENQQLRYKADLIEREPVNVDSLRKRLPKSSCGRVVIHCCDSAEVIPKLLSSKDENQLGLYFVDPSTGIPHFETVAYVSEMRPRMEVLMYLSATNLKRICAVTPEPLFDRMQGIDKSHWMVREPFPRDRHQWTFLLGSNTDLFTNYKKIGFYRLDSEEAQAFFPRLNLTAKQRMERLQPRLFD